PNTQRPRPYKHLLETFGGNPLGSGRSTMKLDEDSFKANAIIEQMGKDTMAGKTSPAGQALPGIVAKQHAQMVATSNRFKASLPPAARALLDKARDLYFGLTATKAELSAARTTLANPASTIAAQLAAEKFNGDAAARKARSEAIRADLKQK